MAQFDRACRMIGLAAAALCLFAACSPMESDKGGAPPAPESSKVEESKSVPA